MDDVRVNGKKILENVPVIFDTGASYIIGDWERISKLYDRLGGTLMEHEGFGYYHREFRLRSVHNLVFIDSLQYRATLSQHWASPSVAGRLKSLLMLSDSIQFRKVLPIVSAVLSLSARVSVRFQCLSLPDSTSVCGTRWTRSDYMA
jgi:hypothetical protein